ncbi:hypothetical protein ANOM_008461 [Aspergillus nomiae NRRL 13137]|uniref:Rhodopsin domain-containing protein n=1 Tax=Aspergillus nomiae NRRL (strain ATCC 15546 / NRRL 13137 / CBS 260.88 / M93) TaxID=1509407 RepID=A0A0L1IRS9_ASPN3|nr:uncharacterized protein ANOM_008461 [Aspergillus nomiae NRRL 13137]KNG82192.1 hypothetical protein ANOM_008461 [Aspergillus nomiae NRRL 13137]
MSNAKAPYQALSDDNRGPLITLVSVTLLIVTFIFVAAKLGSVIYFKQRRPAVNTPIWVALILSIVQVVLMQKSIQHGLGRHIQTLTSAEIRQSSKFYYAAQLTHIIILSLSKLSTTLLLRTLTPSKGIRQSCTITVGLIGAWTAFAFFGIAFQCPLPEPWLYTVIGLAIAHLALLPPFLNSPDTTWTIVNPTICAQAMMCVSVTIACLPTLYHIFAGFHSGLLTTRLPDEVELGHPDRSVYDTGRRTKCSFYTDTARLSNMTPSVVTDITSSRRNRERASESTESLERLTRVSTREGVLRTVDITVEVQEQVRR